MGVIKKHYEDVRLSEEKKAELKYALKDRFPQYARTGSETEVIKLENERITDTGARVKTHSKLKAGIAATAAAALLLTAGVTAIHRMETGGISPGSAVTGYDGGQTGYIEDSSSPYFLKARTIYNHLAKRTAEFETQGIRYTEDCAVINRDTVLAAREQNITCDPQEGDFVSALELAAKLDEQLKDDDDIDLGELDFEMWVNTTSMTPQYVFVYPDDSHSSWYSFPRYEEKESGYIECEDVENEYYVQAKTYYNCIAEIAANAEVDGYSFDGDCFVISRQTVLEARLNNIFPDENDHVLNALDLAAMLDRNYGLAEIGMDPGEVDFEILIDLRSVEPIYVLIYPDDSHESWYSYPRYEGNANMEKDEAIYTSEAKDIYHCLMEITVDYQVQGRLLGVDCSMINRETVRSTQDITVFDESQPVSATELAAKLNERVYSDYSIVIGQLDFSAMINVDTMMPEYVFIYTDSSHETWYSYPAYETEYEGEVEFTTVIDNNDDPSVVTDSRSDPTVIIYPEGYNEDPESEYYAQAVDIHDTFFKALAEAELEGGDTQELYDRFSEIFEQKLREIYGEGFENIDFEVRVGKLDELLLDLQRDDLTPENVHVYVYTDDSHTQFFRCPDYDLVTIPDVTGLSKGEAESVLKEIGLNVVFRGVHYADFPEDTITAFSPAVGAKVTQGSVVTLQYSLGPVNSDNAAAQAEKARKEAETAEKIKEEARRNETEAEHAKAVTSVTMEIPEE